MKPLVLLILASSLSLPLAAQYHPNQDRGFEPDRLYSYSGLDSINSFNGNVILTLPITSYHVGGGLDLTLTAVYNSNVWDLINDSLTITTVPNRHSNAGMSWQVSLGRLIPPTDPTNSTRGNLNDWVFESPDGAAHTLYSTDSNATGYSADSTRYRMTMASTTSRLVGLPDGRILTFQDYSMGQSTDWRIYQMGDRFSNMVTVDYPNTPGYSETWEITDSQGRTQWLYFNDAASSPYPQKILDHIDLTSFGGTTATYKFDYAYRSIARGSKDTTGPSGTPGPNITVALLRSITLPDSTGAANGPQFSIVSPSAAAGTPDPDPYYDFSGVTSGMIRGLQLPTRGWVEWDYTLVNFPAASDDTRTRTTTYGVSQRRLLDDARNSIGTWDYIHNMSTATLCTITDPSICRHSPCTSGAPRQKVTLIVGPPRDGGGVRDTTVNYFSVYASGGDGCTNGEGWTDQEYSSPFTRYLKDNDGRFLSVEQRTGIDPATVTGLRAQGAVTAGTLLRSEYVNFDFDAASYFPWDSNRRERSRRISYDDDPNCGGVACYATVDRYSFDNFGHFRQESHGGNFTGGVYRTTFTDYDGTLDANQEWVLGTYSDQCAADETALRTTAITSCSDLPAAAATFSQFERSTGFLSARRTLTGSGTTLGTTDLLATFEHDSNSRGRITKEKYYGGDTPDQVLSTSSVFTTPSIPKYEVDHTYIFDANGGLTQHQAQHPGTSFLTADEDYDVSTGLVKATRDSALLQTNLEYDPRGRLLWTKPQSASGITRGAWTSYVYSNATPTTAEEVDVLQFATGTTSGTPLTKKLYFFDSIGRLSKQKTMMQDGTLSTSLTSYSGSGKPLSVSQLEASDPPVHFTTYTYDAFGRPATITSPDSTTANPRVTTFSYLGERQKTRSVNIATAPSGDETAATTTEQYDALGRLVSVTEPSGPTTATTPTGSSVTTQYGYDVANRLLSVTMLGAESATPQTRRFQYDNRGFLVSEQHPEKGVNGNGTVSYFSYDARGHAGRKIDGAAGGAFDLTLTYDAAERLTEVDDLVPNTATRRALKKFAFGIANDLVTPSYENGKVVQASRTNHLLSVPGDVVVTETYTYAGSDGRVSRKTTQVTNGMTTIQSFMQSATYDGLGETTSLSYPTCVTNTCSGTSPITSITNVFTNGFLQSVTGYATSITYNANGIAKDIVHGVNAGVNVTDTYSIDPTNGMPRPSSIVFSGYQDCALNTPTIIAPSTICHGGSGQASTAESGVTYVWSISGGTITLGAGTNTITFTAGASGSVTLNLTVSSSCGSASASPVSVAIIVPTASVSGGGIIDANGSAAIQAGLTGTAPWSVTWSDGVTQSNVSTSPAARTVSPPATTTYTVTSMSDAQCSGTSSGSATVSIRPPTPVLLDASATSASQASVTWTTVTGVDHYEIWRSFNNSAYAMVATPTGTSVYNDGGLTGNTTYLYRVRAVTAAGVASNYSNMDPATTVMFTDDPTIAGTTSIKAEHFAELRIAVNAMRASAGLAAWSFTDPVLTIGATPIEAIHLQELRTALDQARTTLSLVPISYTDPVLNSGVTLVKKAHIDELRGGVR